MTIVESTLAFAVFAGLMFGAFEYCRFLYTLHLTNNAARDGARYATANMDKPSNFDTTNYTDASGNVYQSIQNYTTQRLSGADKQMANYQVAAYAVDPTGLTLNPVVIRPMTSSTASPPVYPNPFNSSDPNKVAWNATAFPNMVGVSISGNYQPILPTFLLMPSSVPIYVTAMACSEG